MTRRHAVPLEFVQHLQSLHCSNEYQRGLAAFLAAFNKMHGAANLSKAYQFGIPPGEGTKDGKGKEVNNVKI